MLAVLGSTANEPASNEAPAHMQASHDSVTLSSAAQGMVGYTGSMAMSQSDGVFISSDSSSGTSEGGGDGEDEGSGLGDFAGMSFLLSGGLGGLSGFNAIGDADGDGDGDGGGDCCDGDGDGGD